MFWNLLIKRLLAWLAGITADQWRDALQFVTDATHAFQASEDKKAFVVRRLKAAYPTLSNSVLNLLIETAVSFARRNAG